jgi:UDP-2,3-diacylglucosamine hydrolase
MTILFISDLHLRPDAPQSIENTITFLKSKTKDLEALYILGDLFNTWLGDDIVPHEFETLITTLSTISQSGVQCYLMVGNRDFMVGKAFAQRCGCKLLADPTIIELDGHKILLMHGDSLCIDDVSYQRYRRWTRNALLQRCFLALSSRYRQGISDKIKQKSREQKQFKSAMIMDVNQDEITRIMQQYQIQYMLHGHTHRPAIHHLNKDHYRIVLGDWDQQPSYLTYQDKQFQLFDDRVTGDKAILTMP